MSLVLTDVENSYREPDGAPLPVLKIDSDDRLAFANKTVREVLRADRNEMDGMWFLDLLDGESRGRWEAVRKADPPARQDLQLTLRLRDRVLNCTWQAFPVNEGQPPLPFLLKKLE